MPNATTAVWWIAEIVWQWVPYHRTPDRQEPTAECNSSKPRNSHEVMTGGSQVLLTGLIGHYDAAVSISHAGTVLKQINLSSSSQSWMVA